MGALSAVLHGIQERLNRLHASLARLPATTLAELARQELHAPPPPAPEALAARAGPLAGGAGQLLAAAAAMAPPQGAAGAAATPPPHLGDRGSGVSPQL